MCRNLYNIFVLFYTCVNFWNDKIVQYTTESYLLLRDRLKRFDDQSIWLTDRNFSSICWTVECLGAATVNSRRLIIHRIVITTCFASRLDPSKWGYFANFAASAAETVPLSTLSAVAIICQWLLRPPLMFAPLLLLLLSCFTGAVKDADSFTQALNGSRRCLSIELDRDVVTVTLLCLLNVLLPYLLTHRLKCITTIICSSSTMIVGPRSCECLADKSNKLCKLGSVLELDSSWVTTAMAIEVKNVSTVW